MKKILIAALVLGVTMSASACSEKPASGLSDKVPETKPAQTENAGAAKPEEQSGQGPMQLAFEGRVEGIEAGVGSRLQQVIAELGEPIELGHFEGSSFVSYENMTFMLGEIVESTNEDAEVTGIIASEGYKLYGVQVGMTMDEIKNILGAAQQEYKEGEDEGDVWKLEYLCGDYLLTFYFTDKASPSTSAYLSRLQSE